MDGEVWYCDRDWDGFGDLVFEVCVCEQFSGYSSSGVDCDDNNDIIYFDVVECCNGEDDDCDGGVDEYGDVVDG